MEKINNKIEVMIRERKKEALQKDLFRKVKDMLLNIPPILYRGDRDFITLLSDYFPHNNPDYIPKDQTLIRPPDLERVLQVVKPIISIGNFFLHTYETSFYDIDTGLEFMWLGSLGNSLDGEHIRVKNLNANRTLYEENRALPLKLFGYTLVKETKKIDAYIPGDWEKRLDWLSERSNSQAILEKYYNRIKFEVQNKKMEKYGL